MKLQRPKPLLSEICFMGVIVSPTRSIQIETNGFWPLLSWLSGQRGSGCGHGNHPHWAMFLTREAYLPAILHKLQAGSNRLVARGVVQIVVPSNGGFPFGFAFYIPKGGSTLLEKHSLHSKQHIRAWMSKTRFVNQGLAK